MHQTYDVLSGLPSVLKVQTSHILCILSVGQCNWATDLIKPSVVQRNYAVEKEKKTCPGKHYNNS